MRSTSVTCGRFSQYRRRVPATHGCRRMSQIYLNIGLNHNNKKKNRKERKSVISCYCFVPCFRLFLFSPPALFNTAAVSSRSQVLQKGHAEVISKKKCRKTWKSAIHDRIVCAIAPEKSSARTCMVGCFHVCCGLIRNI